MLHLPTFKKLSTASELDAFSTTYFRCSGFKVQRNYYESNQVFAICWEGSMVGGFVLGAGALLRTLEVFAGNEHRNTLYEHVQQSGAHTEMCCFWMDPKHHKKTWLNFYIWFCVAYALRVFGTKQLIFGTNSARLAALYSSASKCQLLHTDCVFIKNKRSFLRVQGKTACWALQRFCIIK